MTRKDYISMFLHKNNGRGKVKSLDGDKGYGFIEEDDGELFFLEKINFDMEVHMPEQQVTFTIF